MRSGGAMVSERHANFIVGSRGATASDVLRLVDTVRERVRREFDIELEMEIDVWHPVGEGSLV
jgi:UDP-N-acetylmuramate dehydrogenase